MGFLPGDLYVRLTTKEGAWIIEDIIPIGGLLGLYGRAKDGKSFLALGLAEAIANPNRTHFLSHPLLRHGPVAFLQLDNPQSSWINKIKVKLMENDPSLDFSNVHFCDRSMEDCPYPFNILVDGPWLKAQLTPIKPVLCILDTLRDIFPGDENDSSVMSNVLTALLASVPPGCAIMIITHRKKIIQFDTDDLMESLRGSSAIAGKLDTIMALNRSPSGKGSLRYQGRDAELALIKLVHERDSAQWILDEDALTVNEVLRRIMESQPGASQREWARELNRRLPNEWKDTKDAEDAAYSAVKRRLKQLQRGLRKSGSATPDPDLSSKDSINP